MKEQLITFDTAKLAKEKGFDEPCLQAYSVYRENLRRNSTEESALLTISIDYEPYMGGVNSSILWRNQSREETLAPTQSLLQTWIWNNHKLWIELALNRSNLKFYLTIFDCNINGCPIIFAEIYEDGNICPFIQLEKGLQEALKLI